MSSLSCFPPYFQADLKIKVLAKVMDQRFQIMKQEIYDRLFIYNIDSIADETLLLHFALQFRTEGFDIANNQAEKKQLIKQALQIRRHKGTQYAILKVFEAINIDIDIQEWYEYQGLPYLFKVDLKEKTREISTQLRLKLVSLIKKYKNVRSHMEDITLSYLTKLEADIFRTGTHPEVHGSTKMIQYRLVEHQKNIILACKNSAAIIAFVRTEDQYAG